MTRNNSSQCFFLGGPPLSNSPFFSLLKLSVNLQKMHRVADRVVVDEGVIVFFWMIEISIIPEFGMNYCGLASLVELEG